MQERIEEKYILKVWNDSYNRYVTYFSYSTLERLKEQIKRCIEDYNSYPYSKYSSWYIWGGNKRVDLTKAKYIIEHKRYKITKEEILSEVVKNNET